MRSSMSRSKNSRRGGSHPVDGPPEKPGEDPVLFSAAGRVPGTPRGTALAAVATTGYGGYLVGPPLIGLAAEGTSLPVALGILCAAGAAALPRGRP